MPTSSSNVRSQDYIGKHLLRLSSSQFDPKPTRGPHSARHVLARRSLAALAPRDGPDLGSVATLRGGGDGVKVLSPGNRAITEWLLLVMGCFQHIVANEIKQSPDLQSGYRDVLDESGCEWAMI